jgi:hypothetical protein
MLWTASQALNPVSGALAAGFDSRGAVPSATATAAATVPTTKARRDSRSGFDMVAPPWFAAARRKPNTQVHHEFPMVNPINRNDASARPTLCASRLHHVEMRARICHSAQFWQIKTLKVR